MTRKSLGLMCLMAAVIPLHGCATMGDRAVAGTKDAEKPKDEEPRGFVRELWNSGYLPNGRSPSSSYYP